MVILRPVEQGAHRQLIAVFHFSINWSPLWNETEPMRLKNDATLADRSHFPIPKSLTGPHSQECDGCK